MTDILILDAILRYPIFRGIFCLIIGIVTLFFGFKYMKGNGVFLLPVGAIVILLSLFWIAYEIRKHEEKKRSKKYEAVEVKPVTFVEVEENEDDEEPKFAEVVDC